MIVIIDYKTANIGSMVNMLAKAGEPTRVASRPEDLDGASRLILPGIGHFDTCAKNLHELGFVEPLLQKVNEQKIPLLGICVGAQLLTRGQALFALVPLQNSAHGLEPSQTPEKTQPISGRI
jgi:imidazole glycerol-phosphate synthase subunit HisH